VVWDLIKREERERERERESIIREIKIYELLLSKKYKEKLSDDETQYLIRLYK
jgi:hypothetical protein